MVKTFEELSPSERDEIQLWKWRVYFAKKLAANGRGRRKGDRK